MTISLKKVRRQIRHRRIRSKIFGTASQPRLSVFRSNRFIYAQLIDDEKKKTLLSADDRKLSRDKKKTKKTERAGEVGKILGKSALARKIRQAVFDRGGFKYAGRIKALAEASREAGLKF